MRYEGGRQRKEDETPCTPLVSILVVVFNARQNLPELLESIFTRKAEDLELIVIDGGSSDGTVDYLRSHQEKIDYWLSEPDAGIYDAMNKAVARATGTFLLHLNVGDMLLEIPRKDLEKARDTSVDLLSFPVALGARRTFRPSYGMALRFQNTLHHQGTFYRRMQFPSYDPRLKIFADFDANQRLALSGARAVIGATAVAFHATDGVSSQKNQAAMDEFFSVIRKNHGLGATLLARLLGKWRGMKSKLNFS